MKSRSSLLRVLAVGGLSLVLVLFSSAVTLGVTPGTVANGYLQGPAPQKYDGFKIAVAVDFAVWFAALWGFQNLWTQLRTEIQEQRPARPALSALLCALPFSFYIVVGVEMILNRGRALNSGFLFLAANCVSLGACTVAICGLFALAVKRWPRS